MSIDSKFFDTKTNHALQASNCDVT